MEISNEEYQVEKDCEIHGKYTAKAIELYQGRVIHSRCKKCQAKEKQREDEVKKAQDDSERASKISRLLRNSGIPKRFQDKHLEDYKQEDERQVKALSVAMAYSDDIDGVIRKGTSLLLCGTPGTGKTHLAIGVGHRFIKHGKAVAFISTMNAVRRIRESYSRDSNEKETDVIQSFVLPDLLILDEVGQQRGTDDEKLLLFDVINARYENMMPTIIISNLNLSGIREYLGDRAFDRLREGGGKALQFDWESYRRNA